MGLIELLQGIVTPREYPLIRPLTHETAQAMGHVAWIEEKDPVSAMRKMYDALRFTPYNCAVWANAGDRIDPKKLSLLRAWRKANRFSYPDHQTIRQKTISEPFVAYANGYINDYFYMPMVI